MKKLYSTLLATFCVVSIHAQLTQSNHAPSAGDSYKTFQCDSTGINPGSSGAGVNWNFSSLITHSNTVNNYTVTASGNTIYPSASVAAYSGTSNISYYNSTSSNLNYYGGNLMVGTIPSTLIYTSPAVYATYPMTLNSTTTSITGGSITALFPGTFTGTYKVLADGSGSISLPGATYTNVLRVLSTQTLQFNVGLATGTITQSNYDYYAIGIKSPVLTISASTVVTSISAANSQTIVTRLDPPTSGVGLGEFNNNSIDLMVYPNPCSNNLYFASLGAGIQEVDVFDITGKKISSNQLTDGKLKIDVSEWNAGLYFYKALDSNKRNLKSGKITIFH